MPLDAVCLAGVVKELRKAVLGLRVDKIQQPARDQVLLTLRGNKKLLLCAGASQARIHLTEISRENPAVPPMFCMLLRKHLTGGRVADITQPALERVVDVAIDTVDELGEPGRRHLILECIGPRSNLLLTDGEDRIIECLRRVDLEMSQERQVLPGLFYRLPPAQAKANPLETDGDGFAALLSHAGPEPAASAFLLDSFFGLSPLVCRELAFAALGDAGARVLTAADREALCAVFLTWQAAVKAESFTPFLLLRDGVPADFSYRPIAQYGGAMEGAAWDAFSPMLDAFFEAREKRERARERGKALHLAASTARDRTARKLSLQAKEYADTQDRDKYRICGELITANLYRMDRGQTVLRAQNYYDPDCREIDIPLDPRLSPQRNAAKYFKRYAKAKTAERYLAEQMELARRERDWLESVLDELDRAEAEQDFLDIERELRDAGYVKRTSQKKEPRRAPGQPRVFRTSGGFRVLVGRSNTQNDRLTREAFKSDYWFHTQRVHGSHVILCAEGREPDPRSMTEAAMLAAWFSQARGGAQIAVDYTQARNVKKPGGARPGMVVYDPYQTAYVTPSEGLIKKLEEK